MLTLTCDLKRRSKLKKSDDFFLCATEMLICLEELFVTIENKLIRVARERKMFIERTNKRTEINDASFAISSKIIVILLAFFSSCSSSLKYLCVFAFVIAALLAAVTVIVVYFMNSSGSGCSHKVIAFAPHRANCLLVVPVRTGKSFRCLFSVRVPYFLFCHR